MIFLEVSYIGKDIEVSIPATIKTFPVIKIADNYDLVIPEYVSKLNLPDGLKVIGERAFYNSSSKEENF